MLSINFSFLIQKDILIMNKINLYIKLLFLLIKKFFTKIKIVFESYYIGIKNIRNKLLI